jgi:hypothetical protein
MGGRGSSSQSSKELVNRYAITHGYRAVSNLRKRGATDRDIAKIARSYSQNRASGMGKAEARKKAEASHGFGVRQRSTTQGATRKKSTRLPEEPRVNGFGERTNRYITSLSYERSQRPLQKEVNSWFGRGM